MITGLIGPIRIETVTFPVHQVMVIILAPLRFNLPSCSLGLLDTASEPKETGAGEDGFGSQRSILTIKTRLMYIYISVTN